MAAPKSEASSWAVPFLGLSDMEWTAFAWMPWPRCSIWIIPATKANGCRTRKAAEKTWRPLIFIRQFHEILRNEYPGVISIAEESTAFPKISEPPSQGGLGFDFKWNMGWMHDVLAYLGASQKERPAFHEKLTFGSTYQFSEKFVQAFSHDEVVHGKGSLSNKMKAPSRTRANLTASGPLCIPLDLAGKKDPLHGRRVRPMEGMGL